METHIIAGDILLYSPKTFEDALVAKMTHGNYSHVAIAVSNSEVIEATQKGVFKSFIAKPNYVIPLSPNVANERLEYGLSFLYRQLGKQYSYLDIVADGLKALLPKYLSGTPFLTTPNQFDCSVLAVAFLLAIGVSPLPDSFYIDIRRISPNDLWRFANG